MSLLESRDAFPSQADPHATRWLRQHALSKCQRVTSYLSLQVTPLVTCTWSNCGYTWWNPPTNAWLVRTGRTSSSLVPSLREDVLQDTARFWGARATSSHSRPGSDYAAARSPREFDVRPAPSQRMGQWSCDHLNAWFRGTR